MKYNAKKYIQYICCMILTLMSIFCYSALVKKAEFRTTLAMILLSVMGMILIWILLSWINNIVFALTMIKRGYKISLFQIYPLVFSGNKKFSVGLSLGIGDVTGIESNIRGDTIFQEENSIEQYLKTYGSVIEALEILHRIFVMLCVGIIFFNPYIAVYIAGSMVSVMVLYDLESCEFMAGGFYEEVKEEKKLYYCLNNVCTENFNKSVIYYVLQEKCESWKSELNGKQQRMVQGILIDSIYENKDYLSEDRKQQLQKIFHYTRPESIEHKIRLFLLYQLYVEKFGNDEERRNMQMSEQVFKECIQYFPERVREKALKIQKTRKFHECMDIRNKSKVYEEKLRTIAYKYGTN